MPVRLPHLPHPGLPSPTSTVTSLLLPFPSLPLTSLLLLPPSLPPFSTFMTAGEESWQSERKCHVGGGNGGGKQTHRVKAGFSFKFFFSLPIFLNGKDLFHFYVSFSVNVIKAIFYLF